MQVDKIKQDSADFTRKLRDDAIQAFKNKIFMLSFRRG